MVISHLPVAHRIMTNLLDNIAGKRKEPSWPFITCAHRRLYPSFDWMFLSTYVTPVPDILIDGRQHALSHRTHPGMAMVHGLIQKIHVVAIQVDHIGQWQGFIVQRIDVTAKPPTGLTHATTQGQPA